MTQHHDRQEEISWRRHVISQSFHSILSVEEMELALTICDEEFPPDSVLSASGFCQCLTTALPDIVLSRETRLQFLRALRQREIATPLPLRQEEHAPLKSVSSGHRPPRKSSHLTGVYRCGENAAEMGAMIVENVSLGGGRMRLLAPHALAKNMTLHFQCRLDDTHHTIIRLTGQVRWVEGESIGVAFDHSDGLLQTLIDYVAQ